ncbi:MAG TPA: ABC transporter permease [Gaiellaceae bacterium]|jgi:ABC-type polysaccharide/polyol phosphate export permease|nr:ABC transporter permease [Gaiellaceae bacterium]
MEAQNPSAMQPHPEQAEVTAQLETKSKQQHLVRQDEFASERHVYEPHPIGLPPLDSYVRELWRRRQFAFELARTNLRAQHFNTVLGQLWLVLNPLLLTFIYFVLVDIVGRGSRGSTFLAHLMLCLFAFRLVSTSITEGAGSVVGGGKLILNVAFPRALLPLAAVITAFMTFLPTLGVYAVMHAIAGLPVGLHLLWAIPIVVLLLVFASGGAMLIAAVQVYFRDVRSFLPYFLRIWLYASPVLYYVHEVPHKFKPIIDANPLYPLLGELSEVVNRGQNPNPKLLAVGLAWALGAFVLGAFFFVSREREFAVRL